MRIKELIGKTITNIYTNIEYDIEGLDECECFIELDNEIIIDIPCGEDDTIWIKNLNPKAVSLFKDLSDYPVYYINKNKKSLKAITDKYKNQNQSLIGKLKKNFLEKNPIKEYEPYKIEYQENKLKYIQNKVIVDFLWYGDNTGKGYIQLDNGYIITETIIAPHGIGVGLNYYAALEDLIKSRGIDILKLSEN